MFWTSEFSPKKTRIRDLCWLCYTLELLENLVHFSTLILENLNGLHQQSRHKWWTYKQNMFDFPTLLSKLNIKSQRIEFEKWLPESLNLVWVQVSNDSPVSRSFFSTGLSNLPLKLMEAKSNLDLSNSSNSLNKVTSKQTFRTTTIISLPIYEYDQHQNFKKKQRTTYIYLEYCGEGRKEGRNGTYLASMSRYLPALMARSISSIDGCLRFCRCFFVVGRVVLGCGIVMCMGLGGLVLVWLVWINGGEWSEWESLLVGREARVRGLVVERKDKQYMVVVWVSVWLCLLLLDHVGVGFFLF